MLFNYVIILVNKNHTTLYYRHGLVIYLLQHGVSDKIIAIRLGHSSAATTIKYYMVITPEIERDVLRGYCYELLAKMGI